MTKTISAFFYLSLISLALISACACSGSDSGEPANNNQDVVINVSPDNIDVTNETTSTKISVSANADWSITSDASWCKCFPSGG